VFVDAQGTFTQVSPQVVAVFVTRSEADTYIVKKAWSHKKKGASEVIVVSSDRQIIIGVRITKVCFMARASCGFLQKTRHPGRPEVFCCTSLLHFAMNNTRINKIGCSLESR
jgi:hypothetical protein